MQFRKYKRHLFMIGLIKGNKRYIVVKLPIHISFSGLCCRQKRRISYVCAFILMLSYLFYYLDVEIYRYLTVHLLHPVLHLVHCSF